MCGEEKWNNTKSFFHESKASKNHTKAYKSMKNHSQSTKNHYETTISSLFLAHKITLQIPGRLPLAGLRFRRLRGQQHGAGGEAEPGGVVAAAAGEPRAVVSSNIESIESIVCLQVL